MEDNLRMSDANAARKWDIMQLNDCHQHPKLVQGHNHYMSDSPWHKQQPTS